MGINLEKTIELATQALQAHKFDEAQLLFQRALEEAKAWHEELSVALCLDNLGETLFQQGLFEKAEPYYQQALEIRRKHLPSGHEDIVGSLNNLSVAYFFQGKYALAKPLCEQLLAIYEIVLGKEHPEIATCLINLGLIASAERKFGQAEKHFAEAHNIRLASFGPQHALVGNSMSHLGNVYLQQKRFTAASEMFKGALTILEKHLDLQHPDIERIIGKLVESLEQSNETTEVQALYQRLINLREMNLGPAHPIVADSLEKLANLYLKEKKYNDAAKIFQRLLSMKRRAFGDTHPEVAHQLINLALLQQAEGHPGQGETLFLQAINIYENNSRTKSANQTQHYPSFLNVLKSLATFYESDGRFNKAEKQWRRLLDMLKKEGNKYPELLLDSYEHLANCLPEANQTAEAQILLHEALDFLDKKDNNAQMIGESYQLKRAAILTKLANTLKQMDKFDQAETYYKNALDILVKLLGPHHPNLAVTLEGYADLLTRTYREAEAEHMIACARSLAGKV